MPSVAIVVLVEQEKGRCLERQAARHCLRRSTEIMLKTTKIVVVPVASSLVLMMVFRLIACQYASHSVFAAHYGYHPIADNRLTISSAFSTANRSPVGYYIFFPTTTVDTRSYDFTPNSKCLPCHLDIYQSSQLILETNIVQQAVFGPRCCTVAGELRPAGPPGCHVLAALDSHLKVSSEKRLRQTVGRSAGRPAAAASAEDEELPRRRQTHNQVSPNERKAKLKPDQTIDVSRKKHSVADNTSILSSTAPCCHPLLLNAQLVDFDFSICRFLIRSL
ncbi:unnamed protein product [Soboliphyme baturini]|uniref:Uncharacterized protein n=1 Tax=Soboliphyme baturini TaxID=241478 RepID=A0A183IF14_9BILA|nr:unnamed protein product [Soboliphyme baturini]